MTAMLLGGCASTSASGPGLAGSVPRSVHASARLTSVAKETRRPELDGLIAKYSALYHVPEPLIRRVIVRESRYNPRARNGPYWGLMQIRYDTARGMGYRGTASGLLDADTNLRYAVKYLSGAYIVGDRNADQAVHNYAHGYYYSAKAKGLLEEVGLR
jgi:soluble lytic murein transglycosylase-like protein